MQDIIYDLILNERSGKLSDSEADRLRAWRDAAVENEENYEKINRSLDDYILVDRFESIDIDHAWANVERRLVVKPKIIAIRRYVVAAACAIFVGIFALLAVLRNLDHSSTNELTSVLERKMDQHTTAYIQLADGTKMDLNTEQGTLHLENGLTLGNNSEGVLHMDVDDRATDGTQWVDIIVPKGSSYQLVLNDGTKVFLNAESKLHYPLRFASTHRDVDLSGEALFEVAKNPNAPFSVNSNGMRTRVLGTTFNVSSYPEDRVQHITLVEGKVEVAKSDKAYILSPGEQFLTEGSKSRVQDVDTELYTSWTRGTVRFQGMKLEDMVLKIQRWYDVDFAFQDPSTKSLRFTGAFDRTARLGDLLTVIESMTNVRFTEQGGVIKVQKK
ncbi:FecR family protein [Sphingobacterium paucimobilis]|uniref:FecR protein domain-containing protein n=1 Tax=Sphingobacterium paucimobilis HER1398 TaxID=1346330 RepID=U2HUU7_9SPHI|nr:FecR domain-containing protein [Sphingobacterium paucimobilis]ERJ59030.1 hypothetical protein M472_09630 [Sphingobacterium paucimobilis HER1398]